MKRFLKNIVTMNSIRLELTRLDYWLSVYLKVDWVSMSVCTMFFNLFGLLVVSTPTQLTQLDYYWELCSQYHRSGEWLTDYEQRVGERRRVCCCDALVLEKLEGEKQINQLSFWREGSCCLPLASLLGLAFWFFGATVEGNYEFFEIQKWKFIPHTTSHQTRVLIWPLITLQGNEWKTYY